MKTSQIGISFIKRFEGCRLTAYQDIAGIWTIGYGSTAGVQPGMTITQAEADATLLRRLRAEFEPPISHYIEHSPTTQNQFDAMISLTWNIGVSAFLHHCSVPTFHIACLYDEAANAFLRWNRAAGRVIPALMARRAAEAALYRKPQADPAQMVV